MSQGPVAWPAWTPAERQAWQAKRERRLVEAAAPSPRPSPAKGEERELPARRMSDYVERSAPAIRFHLGRGMSRIALDRIYGRNAVELALDGAAP